MIMKKKLVSPIIVGLAAATGAIVTSVALRHRDAPAVAPVSAPSPNPEGARQISLSSQVTPASSVKTSAAQRHRLAADIQVVGTVSYDQNQYAVVGPLVSGRVTRLAAGVGDPVRKGQILAEIDSAEVGQARAELIAHRARLSAAETNLRREKELAEKRVSSAREFELAQAASATEKAGVHAAMERLRAIGLSEVDIRVIEQRDSGGRVPIRAPLAGVVLERLVTLGQAVERATDAFKIANVHELWVQLELYEKDLDRVKAGQQAEVRAEAFPGKVFRARVEYVSPIINPDTRTAKVRVEISNPEGQLRIGQLITARLAGDSSNAREVVAVPRSAIQRVEDKPVVFVKQGTSFRARPIEPGITAGELTEVRKGVAEGDEVATDGAFLLKSELLR